jgi:KDO2-lipid IV(A) lauroyltransferase
VALSLAKGIGFVSFYLVTRERTKALANLRQGWGQNKSEKEIRTIARNVFINLALTACDFALLPKFDKQFIRSIVRIEGVELLHNLKNQHSGVIIVTAHIGNWEFMAPSIIDLGYNGPVLARRLRDRNYNDFIVRIRESHGVINYYTDQSPRALIKILKDGGMIGILPDQDIKGFDGIFVDFFGHKAYTPTGPVKIALAAHVPILMTYLLRDRDRYRLIFDSVIDTKIAIGETKEAAIARITTAWSSNIEKYIRQYPEQWAWIHNRWKTQPDNIPDR